MTTSDPIDPRKLSGHQGFVVVAEGAGPRGELDPTDEVRRLFVDHGRRGVYEPQRGDLLGERVDWNDRDFVAARQDFQVLQGRVENAGLRFEEGSRRIDRGQKPRESWFSEIEAQMAQIAGPLGAPSDASPYLRSQANAIAGATLGIISRDYRTLTGKIEPSKQGYLRVQEAFEADPDNPDAYLGYTLANLFVQSLSNGWPLRKQSRAIEMLGIDPAAEMARCIEVLQRHTGDYRAQALLAFTAEAWIHTRDRTRDRFGDPEAWQRDLSRKYTELEGARRRGDRARVTALTRAIEERTAQIQRVLDLRERFAALDPQMEQIARDARARADGLRGVNPERTRQTDELLAKMREAQGR